MTDQLPLRLVEIDEQVRLDRPAPSNLHALEPIWKAHVARASQVPGIQIADQGESLYLGELSPGCRACQEGTWDCIFTTLRCNLDCPFCYSPQAAAADDAGSAFGTTPDEIAQNHSQTHISAISFSGGEPFLQPDRLLSWVEWFTSRYPDRYYWVYTNGLLAAPEMLARLAVLGLDEIRFNAAATGYDHPTVMEHIAAASRCIPQVTVEIPAIPADADKLLSCLAAWQALGVRLINLHELIYEPGTRSAQMPGPRQPVVTADGHCCAINPQSRALTLAVMQHVQDEGLALSVNDCSLQRKLGQLRGRRSSLAPLVKARHEELVGGQFLISCCAYRGQQELDLFPPGDLDRMRRQHPDARFVRVARTAPLSIHDPGKWVAFETLDAHPGPDMPPLTLGQGGEYEE